MPKAVHPPVLLVAITGGSGAGKSWLANRLRAGLRGKAIHLSMDNFYRDRSGVPALRRAKINFDDPRAMDWREVERVTADLAQGRSSQAPIYDFKTHTRLSRSQVIEAKPVVIMEGLWLLRRRALRKMFSLRVFLYCPTRVRLRRRLTRDVATRDRSRKSIESQFRNTVEPMHQKYVDSQQQWADLVIHSGDTRSARLVLNRIRALRANQQHGID